MREAVLITLALTCAVVVLACLWLRLTQVASDPPVARFAAWTLAGGAATVLLVASMSRLLRRDGTRLESFGVPNLLTVLRFVLIAPTVVLLADQRYPEALVCYVVLFMTDVADGIVARRRGLTSEFGVVADPLADVASTFAVFAVFFRDDLVPAWLFGILLVRYGMLFLGSLLMTLATGPIHYQATAPGKIVGVVQAVGACLIMGGAMMGGLDPTTERVLFAFLGIGFASIVGSQAVIGWRLARRRATLSGPTR